MCRTRRRRGSAEARAGRGRPPADARPRIAGTGPAERPFAVGGRLPYALVIGADQVLAQGGDLLDKPGDPAVARTAAQRLRGRQHRLHTAAALAQGGRIVWSHAEIATLTMRTFSPAFLGGYLAKAGPAVCARRRLRDRGPRHPAPRARRRRPFHHRRPAAAALAGGAQGSWSGRVMSIRRPIHPAIPCIGSRSRAARPPLPLVGRGRGWGDATRSSFRGWAAVGRAQAAGVPPAGSPHPYPLPIEGRGRVCGGAVLCLPVGLEARSVSVYLVPDRTVVFGAPARARGRHDPGVRHRLAGGAFALADDPRLLAEDATASTATMSGRPSSPEAVRGLPAGIASSGYAGCNVTLPPQGGGLSLRRKTAPRRRGPSARRTRSGSRATRSSATTPTAPGFMSNLRRPRRPILALPGARVAVLGAGGAARGVVVRPARGRRRRDPSSSTARGVALMRWRPISAPR